MIDALLWCLALNVYHEARGEPRAGQLAVAEVTLRRAEISGRGVCNEVFSDRQFSWTLAERPTVQNSRAWAYSQEVARDALAFPTKYSRGATHFHVTAMRPLPKWRLRLCKTAVIGRHTFYKECPK